MKRTLLATAILLTSAGVLANIDTVDKLFQQFLAPWIQRGMPKQRPVFQKPHGFAAAQFKIAENLDTQLKIGVFSQPGRAYQAWVRMSADTPGDPSDHAGNTVGFAIKLLDVGAVGHANQKNSTEANQKSYSQDFILQNQPTFFLDTPKEFVALIDGSMRNENPEKFAEIIKRIDATNKSVSSLLEEEYWSSVPFRFGNTFVKYHIKPMALEKTANELATGEQASRAKAEPQKGPNFLTEDLKLRLATNTVTCFNFYVQFFESEESTPVEKPTVLWTTPFHKVATIAFPKQSIDAIEGITDTLAYRPGNGLNVHAPAGALNKARAEIYQRSSDARKEKYGLTRDEPAFLPADKAALFENLKCPEVD